MSKCRGCGEHISFVMADLGTAPPSNSYLNFRNLNSMEISFPLRVLVCVNCWFVQTEDFVNREQLFTSNYAYLSSVSTLWLSHSKQFAHKIQRELLLDSSSLVIEVAANDGYLLQYFQELGIPCLGIEPTEASASIARERGIPIVQDYFGDQVAGTLKSQGYMADLIVANNVLAHVPDIHDFISGFKTLLKPSGVISFEFPHVLQLLKYKQFDTMYHEHFSYLSLVALLPIFDKFHLKIVRVESIPTHGGSLRIYVMHKNASAIQGSESVINVLEAEIEFGIGRIETYRKFQEDCIEIKNSLISFLISESDKGRIVVGYGAAAKGNTLLNYCGVKKDLIPYVIDKSPSKIGKFLPGSRIPIVDESHLIIDKPNTILILPWNLLGEVTEQLAYCANWEASYAVAIPKLKVCAFGK